MAKTALKLSAKANTLGRCQVIVKLTVTRTNRPCFKSGVFVSPDWFKPIQETSKGNIYGIVPPKKGRLNLIEVREAEQAKSDLDAFINKLEKVCGILDGREKITHDSLTEAMKLVSDVKTEDITYHTIENRKDKKSEVANSKTFFEWFDMYLSESKVSEGRQRCFRVLGRMLARYQGFVRMTEKDHEDFTLDIETINEDIINDFFDYISNERQLSEEYPQVFETLLKEYPAEITPKHANSTIEERGNNAVIERKKQLRAFFNWLYNKKYTQNRPMDRCGKIGSPKYGTPYYLTLEERNLIYEHQFKTKHLQTQADIFVFQCCVGCRVSDLMSLTPDKLKENGTMLEYVPRKTKDENPFNVSVALNGRARALIEKYEGVDKKGRLFPFISSQKYNDAIKEILTICDITRKVTVINPTTGEEEQRPINEIASSHMARRTFIGNLYKKVQDPNLIGSMSGHVEGSRAFSRYRSIDSDTKKNVVSLID